MKDPMIWGHHDLMVTAAHRYCLGRRTYIVSQCVEWLMHNWEKFEDTTKKLIIEETQEALERNNAGDACDIDQWQSLIKFHLKNKK